MTERLEKLDRTAAMGLADLEVEAKAKARKQVANLLQRPDQLEKVEQIRKRVSRKKTSVEAMLKTAVQSQLDGVRTGLNQLQNALEDIREIHNALNDVDQQYRGIAHLGTKLKKVREENSRHSQLAAAVENLKHIFNVPEVVKKTEDFINDGKLLHAHKAITELEMARDDLLFELHRQTQQSPTDKNMVCRYFAEVEKLSESLGKQLWLILQRLLSTIRREPTIIVTVLRIIEREERMDAEMLKRYDQCGFLPPNRPKRWRVKCFAVLEETLQSRIEGCQMEDRTTDKMWLVRHLEVTRQLVLEDLRVVKTLCEPCFPPDYDIVNKYVEMYHNSISAHLNEIKLQGLEGNEIVSLLSWVGAYQSKELMGHNELKIDTSHLGPILEDSVIQELQNQYLQTLRGNFEEWMNNSLRSDIKDWHQESQPDADDKGYFNTSLPVILFQMIEQNLTVASTINDRLVESCLNMCMDELASFSRTYKAELGNYQREHAADRSKPTYFIQYMIANVNNAQTFVELIKVMQNKFSKGDIDEACESDRCRKVGKLFHSVAQEGCGFLLDEVFLDLEPHLVQLFTKSWVVDQHTVDTICITIEDYCQDFVHLKNHFFEDLLSRCQQRVLISYMRALFSRKIKFRSYEERLPAAEKMSKEADQMQNLFERLGVKPAEGASPFDSPFDPIPNLAEVIKLKDTSMMSLELSNLGNKYPDIRTEQLVNLLIMRGDVGTSDARQMVIESIGEDESRQCSEGIFLRI